MFLDLFQSIDNGTYYAFDEFVHDSSALRVAMRAGDWLGSYVGVIALSLLALLLLLRQRRPGAAAALLGVLLAGCAGVEVMRRTIAAARPTVAATLLGDDESLRSFPAREIFTFALAASLLVWAAWPWLERWQLRIALTALLTALVLWVAMSQLMLGLHFVTDVAAGLAGGVALALLGTRLAPPLSQT